MIKVVVLIKKRPDITTEQQFRDHYGHRPCPARRSVAAVLRHVPRNLGRAMSWPQAEFGWDVITELEFADRVRLRGMAGRLLRPEVVDQIRADEADFLVWAETRMWEVSPCSSDYSEDDRGEPVSAQVATGSGWAASSRAVVGWDRVDRQAEHAQPGGDPERRPQPAPAGRATAAPRAAPMGIVPQATRR